MPEIKNKGVVKKHLTLLIALVFFIPQVSFAEDDILTTAAANGSFKTLTSLVVAADLDDAFQNGKNLTVFAPSDEAFAKLPDATLKSLLQPENREKLAQILQYHVLPDVISVPKRNSHPLKSAKTLGGLSVNFDRQGTEVKINDANIVIRNIKCSNGLIHVIDSVLLPPTEDKTIVGVAKKAGKFKTLLAAAKAAGLVETLSSDGPLTLFAPNDSAFGKLPKGTVESLLKPENRDKLAAILKYHVVAEKVTARQAVTAGSAKTVGGSNVDIRIDSGSLKINDSRVIANDLETSNGIIHVIDQVLLPKAEGHSSKQTPKAKGNASDNQREVTITSDWSRSVNRDGIKADKITIKIGGAGSVNLTNVEAKQIVTSIGGGGRLSIDGVVVDHDVKVSGGGVLRARDLVSQNTSVKVYGGGVAVVNATEALNASANAGAKLRYVGTDAKIVKAINKYAEFSKVH